MNATLPLLPAKITTLNLEYFNPLEKILAILGKEDRFRLVELKSKTAASKVNRLA